MQFGFSQSAPDPFSMTLFGGASGMPNWDVSTKTLSTQSLNGGLKNCILIIAGQSNVANSFPTNYTPTNSTKVDNLNVYDGAIYRAVDPLLGCASGISGTAPTGGNFAGRLADKLINAGKFDRVILVPIGVDGSTAANWQSPYSDRLQTAIRRLAAKGMTPTAILWGQGETDHGTAQATYQASLTAVINVSRTEGYTGPWFIAQQTWLSGATDATVRAAQAAIVSHPGIWAGPDADTLNATNRQGDNTHFNDTGSDAYAGLWQTALGLYGAPF